MKVTLIALLFGVSLNAWALRDDLGPGSSGGGAGIFCPLYGPGSDQPEVQVLDLYEGQILEGYTVTESNIPFAVQLDAIAAKLSFNFSLKRDFLRALSEVQAVVQFLPAGVSIHVPSDLGTGEAVPFPTGCEIEAIGFYQSNNRLKISTDAFQKMSETQKAAFYAHEALYKLYREFSQAYSGTPLFSTATRKLNAALFANESNTDLLRTLSEEMTWANVDGSFADWHPAPGMESHFVSHGAFSPMLVPAASRIATLRIFNRIAGDYNWAQISCAQKPWGNESSNLENGSELGEDFEVSIDIQDCPILFVSNTTGTSGPSPGFEWSVVVDGVPYLSGRLDNSMPPGQDKIEQNFPLYKE